MNISNLMCGTSLMAAVLFPSTLAAQSRGLEAFDWRVPIHTMGDDPAFGPYGIWAAGRGYKVSFHDGMCFYPVLGSDAPRHLPVRWHTESVRMGADELLGSSAQPSQHFGAWRFEYRSAGVSEVYDVRAEGVEQSFVISRPPDIDGDLQVVGRWSSPLEPVRDSVPGSTRAAIRFVGDGGRDVVRYGAAIAFDASGRRVDVATDLRGDEIRLTVPAAWVRSAHWPITIDPLLSANPLASVGSMVAAVEHSDIEAARGSAVHRVMTTFSVPTSASDCDTYALLTDEDLGNPVIVFADLGTAVDSTHPRVAFVDQAGSFGRWVIAMERRSTRGVPLPSQVRVWLHDAGNTTLQSGTMLFLPLTAVGWNDRRPDIGGSRTDQNALLVYETDDTFSNPGTTELYRVGIDADAGTFGPQVLVDSTPVVPFSSRHDRANPSVIQTSEGAPLGWIVCYQERARLPDHWYLKARRIRSDGVASPEAIIADSLPGEPGNIIEPSVDGSNTRYGVSYLLAGTNTSTTGTKVAMTRFLWAPAALLPTVQWTAILDTAGALETLDDPRTVGDSNVGNWAVAYREKAQLGGPADRVLSARVGFDGTVVESQTVYSNLLFDGAAPSIAYDFPKKRFLVAYGTEQSSSPVFGRIWTYPPDALNIPYGSSCGGDFGAVTTPLVGTEFFRVPLTGARRNTPAVLWVAGQSTFIDLGLIGMGGCSLLVGPSPIVSVPAVTDGLGGALITIPGLTVPGDLYMQWAHIAPGANIRNVLTTGGMLSQIR